jgi:hypothetical protein
MNRFTAHFQFAPLLCPSLALGLLAVIKALSTAFFYPGARLKCRRGRGDRL